MTRTEWEVATLIRGRFPSSSACFPTMLLAPHIWRKPIGSPGLSAQSARRQVNRSASPPALASCAAENVGAIPGLRQEL